MVQVVRQLIRAIMEMALTALPDHEVMADTTVLEMSSATHCHPPRHLDYLRPPAVDPILLNSHNVTRWIACPSQAEVATGQAEAEVATHLVAVMALEGATVGPGGPQNPGALGEADTLVVKDVEGMVLVIEVVSERPVLQLPEQQAWLPALP